MRSRLARCALLATLSLSLFGCGKANDTAAKPTATATTGGAPTAAPEAKTVAAASFDVPFKGTYKKTAKVAFKNGQRFVSPANQGVATMTIEPGKVTYHLEYQSSGATVHITETYSFTQANVRAIPGGGYDVDITFVKMDSDTNNYNPDSKSTKIEARRQAGNTWEVGFLYSDTAGVQAGMEFR